MSRVHRLILSEFRNYAALDLAITGQLVALSGENGAGKTNILEALSLLSPGRGLRRADFQDIARQSGSGSFAISVELQGALGLVQLGAGLASGESGRKCRIDREPVSSANAFADHCRLLWLTPENDGLFRGPAGDRRRFLDRLVLALHVSHGSRVNALEKALRSRNRLLEDKTPDSPWLDAVEREAAEQAVAVAAARKETVERLAAIFRAQDDPDQAFPHAEISLEGDLERALENGTALDVEDWYRNSLRENRWRDQAAGRTLIGPNTADLVVRHGPKNMPAQLSSTGEQKALLIGLILAHAKLVQQMSGDAPIILLDEVAAHLDPIRRKALFLRLNVLGGQVWMTGTDARYFDDMPGEADLFHVTTGDIKKG